MRYKTPLLEKDLPRITMDQKTEAKRVLLSRLNISRLVTTKHARLVTHVNIERNVLLSLSQVGPRMYECVLLLCTSVQHT